MLISIYSTRVFLCIIVLLHTPSYHAWHDRCIMHLMWHMYDWYDQCAIMYDWYDQCAIMYDWYKCVIVWHFFSANRLRCRKNRFYKIWNSYYVRYHRKSACFRRLYQKHLFISYSSGNMLALFICRKGALSSFCTILCFWDDITSLHNIYSPLYLRVFTVNVLQTTHFLRWFNMMNTSRYGWNMIFSEY